MSSVNKVIIVGNLGDDPKINYSSSGSTITNLSVATTESYKDKQRERTRKNEG
jgi:single-strand DNA-binding protein